MLSKPCHRTDPIALRLAGDLRRREGEAVALLAPPRGVPGAHDADREVCLLSGLQPALGLERVGMVEGEEVVVVGRGTALRQDLYRGPPREGEVDRAGGEPRHRIGDAHLAMEASRIGGFDVLAEQLLQAFG